MDARKVKSPVASDMDRQGGFISNSAYNRPGSAQATPKNQRGVLLADNEEQRVDPQASAQVQA